MSQSAMSTAESAAPTTLPAGKKPPRYITCQRCSMRLASSPTICSRMWAKAPRIASERLLTPHSPIPEMPSSVSTTQKMKLRRPIWTANGSMPTIFTGNPPAELRQAGTVPRDAGRRLVGLPIRGRRGPADPVAGERGRVHREVAIDVADPVLRLVRAWQDVEAVGEALLVQPLVEQLDVRAPGVVLADVERDRQASLRAGVGHDPERAGGLPLRLRAVHLLELRRELVERRPQ